MRVFVTGASGFIGSHVVKALVNSDHTVLGLVLPGDSVWRLSEVLDRVELLKGDLRQLASIQNDLQSWQPEACIHLAWYAEPRKYLHSRENLASMQESLDLLCTLYEIGCEHFIGAGTCAEYEMKSGLLAENDLTNPETLYAATKLSFKLIGEQIARQYRKQFTWGRIFYLYGSHEDSRRLVPAAILKLINGEAFETSPGEQVRDFLHVEDVANAFVVMMEQKISGTYNICSSEPVSVKTLLNTIGRLLARPDLLHYGALPYREWEPMYICGNNDRLKSIGWRPRFHIQSGLENVIPWWKINQEQHR
jgi:nucleoside-diphosphate-sugar epimerase